MFDRTRPSVDRLVHLVDTAIARVLVWHDGRERQRSCGTLWTALLQLDPHTLADLGLHPTEIGWASLPGRPPAGKARSRPVTA